MHVYGESIVYLLSGRLDACMAAGDAGDIDSSQFSLTRSCVLVRIIACSNVLCFALQFLQLPEGHLLATCVVERSANFTTVNY